MIRVGGALVASTVVLKAYPHDRVSIWSNAVLRGDDGPITVGEESNI